jgi:DNA repair exonuclease SbcCD nuclease subunit
MQRTKPSEHKKADSILSSDWHLRETTPTCRTDDFWTSQWEKVVFVKKLQMEHNCPVLHGGDLFHHWKPSPNLLSYAFDLLPREFHTVYGQHDLPQHNWENRERSGIHNLATVGAVTILDNVHWGGNPEIELYPSFEIGDRQVLVWHHMVWQGKRLWPGQTDPSAVAVLKKYPEYDLILTGDNHKPFVEELEGRILVNPGSLTRQNADQIDHRPRVYLYYVDTNTVEAVYLPMERDAVTREHIENAKARDERITAFVERLDGDWQAGLSFEQNLEIFFQNNQVRESVKQIIYNAIESEKTS